MAKAHHTKTKGDIGVLKVQCSLAENGYTVLLPLTEHASYDLVAEKAGAFRRIQVKYRSAYNGKIEVTFKNTWSDKSGRHVVQVDKNEVDLYAVYCPDTDKVYYFDPKEFSASITLRFTLPRNNNQKGFHLADNYTTI